MCQHGEDEQRAYARLLESERKRAEEASKPHRFWPDYEAMGDCIVCGHVADSPLHLK